MKANRKKVLENYSKIKVERGVHPAFWFPTSGKICSEDYDKKYFGSRSRHFCKLRHCGRNKDFQYSSQTLCIRKSLKMLRWTSKRVSIVK